jgi:hypothetical protein
MRSIIGLKFIDEVLDMEVHSRLGNRQLIGYLFVAMAIPDQP